MNSPQKRERKQRGIARKAEIKVYMQRIMTNDNNCEC